MSVNYSAYLLYPHTYLRTKNNLKVDRSVVSNSLLWVSIVQNVLHSSGSSSLSWGLWWRLCTSVLIVPLCVCVCVYIPFCPTRKWPMLLGVLQVLWPQDLSQFSNRGRCHWQLEGKHQKSLRFEEKHPKSCRHTTSVCCLFCRADYGFTTSLFSR